MDDDDDQQQQQQPRGSKRSQRDETANNGDEAMTDAGDTQPPAPPSQASPQPPPTLKLRNYRPKDKSIAYQTLPRPSYNKDTEWLDGELASVVRSAMADDSDLLLAIAPQSINSDLKRDIAPQLAILKRQTRQALQQIINERVAAQRQEDEDGADER